MEQGWCDQCHKWEDGLILGFCAACVSGIMDSNDNDRLDADEAREKEQP